MKLRKKMFIVLIIFFVLFNIYICSQVFASSGTGSTSSIVNYLKGKNVGFSKPNAFTNILGVVVGVIQVAAVGYVIADLSVAGIRFFTVNSATGKVQGRIRLLNAFIRCLLVFGAASIFKILYEIFAP